MFISRSARPLIQTLALLAILLTLMTMSAEAKNYVSLNGKFYFSYPDDWRQVDYNTVDYYLTKSQASAQTFQYEAVFAPVASAPFHSGPYVIVTIDSIGQLSDRQKDSLVKDLGISLSKAPAMEPFDQSLAEPKDGVPFFDRSADIAGLFTTINQSGQPLRKSILILKFFNRGVVNFYFFTPDSVYAIVRPIIKSMLTSFSTENLEAATPKESVKIASEDKIKSGSGSTNLGSSERTLWMIVALVFVLVLIVIIRRQSKAARYRNAGGKGA